MTKPGFALSAALLHGSAATYTFAADRGFDGLVSGIAQSYDAQATRIPMMSLVSLCARVATHGGVKGLRVVEFHNLKTTPGHARISLSGPLDPGIGVGTLHPGT
jgi:hypothetical protein